MFHCLFHLFILCKMSCLLSPFFFPFLPAADTHHSHISVDGQYPTLSTSPGVPHLRFNRRASEASLASQVSGLADSYTASNIATSEWARFLVPSHFNSHIVVLMLSFPPSKPPPANPLKLANTRRASLNGPGCCTTSWPPGGRPCSRATKLVRCFPKPTEWSLSPART